MKVITYLCTILQPTWDNADLQERMAALEAQVKQLGLQASKDCERITKDRTVTLQLLHKVRTCSKMHYTFSVAQASTDSLIGVSGVALNCFSFFFLLW